MAPLTKKELANYVRRGLEAVILRKPDVSLEPVDVESDWELSGAEWNQFSTIEKTECLKRFFGVPDRTALAWVRRISDIIEQDEDDKKAKVSLLQYYSWNPHKFAHRCSYTKRRRPAKGPPSKVLKEAVTEFHKMLGPRTTIRVVREDRARMKWLFSESKTRLQNLVLRSMAPSAAESYTREFWQVIRDAFQEHTVFTEVSLDGLSVLGKQSVHHSDGVITKKRLDKVPQFAEETKAVVELKGLQLKSHEVDEAMVEAILYHLRLCPTRKKFLCAVIWTVATAVPEFPNSQYALATGEATVEYREDGLYESVTWKYIFNEPRFAVTLNRSTQEVDAGPAEFENNHNFMAALRYLFTGGGRCSVVSAPDGEQESKLSEEADSEDDSS